MSSIRVTESRLLRIATAGALRSQSRVAEAQTAVSTGIAVDRPSKSVSSWVTAKRAQMREIASEGRAKAIDRSKARLSDTERALTSVSDSLHRIREIAIQSRNATLNALDRAALALEVRALTSESLRQLNTRGHDGEYLLAGTNVTTEAFSSTGVYQGDSVTREVEVGPNGQLKAVGVSGELLTSASGVDLFDVLERFAVALETDNTAGIDVAIGELATLTEQVTNAVTFVGVQASAMERVDGAREDLELELARRRSDAQDGSPIDSASEFARAIGAFEAARTVAERIVQLVRP